MARWFQAVVFTLSVVLFVTLLWLAADLHSSSRSISSARKLAARKAAARSDGPRRKAQWHIAGVPIYERHYLEVQRLHQKSKGQLLLTSSGEPRFDWILVLGDGAGDLDVALLCMQNFTEEPLAQERAFSSVECLGHGTPSSGGLAIAGVRATKREFKDLVRRHAAELSFAQPSVPIHVPKVRHRRHWRRARRRSHRVFPQRRRKKTNKRGSDPWNLDKLDGKMDGVYNYPPSAGKGVNVFVVDSGVRTSHRDLAGRAVPAAEIFDGNYKVCDAKSTDCAQDKLGHGTHCAGIIAGTRWGVAKKATVQSVKVLNDRGEGSLLNMILALNYVVSSNVRPAVVSASIGIVGRGKDSVSDYAIKRAVANGVVVVVAAGNDGDKACEYAIANSAQAVTVGATDIEDRMAYFSNYGKCIDIFAPGVSVRSTWYTDDESTEELSGTSEAAPHVAGAAALVLGVTPKMAADKVGKWLAKSAASSVQAARGSPNRFLNINKLLKMATSAGSNQTLPAG